MATKEGRAIWQGEGMKFTGMVPSGASLTFNSEGDAFRPMEMLVLGLAGCTAMDVIDILRKKRQAVTAFEVVARGETAEEHPHMYKALDVTYIVTGTDIDPAAVERAMQLSETKYCGAMATLRQAAPVTLKYEIRVANPQ
mgnify:CR=1 FL=1